MTREQTLDEPISPSVMTPSPASTGLVRAAAIIGIGNVASRVLGLVRVTVIAYLFGATGLVSVYQMAATIIQTLYDFLVGGMVSAALVPVFSDLIQRKDREELWRIASVVINALAITLAIVVLVLELFAPQLVWILGSGYDESLQAAAVDMIRLILPAVFFLGMSGVITGLLYSLKRFAYPAFTTAIYNAGIVVLAFALAPALGITSLILGTIVGSALQVALQLPGLRDMGYRFSIDITHPAIRRVLRLYAPVIAGLAIGTIGVAIDRNLASHTGDQSLAWMAAATVLIQFPLGLVATAVSFAVLPELARQTAVVASPASLESSAQPRLAATDSRMDASPNAGFNSTLAFGIKVVLLLILPATVGLFVLAGPIVALVFERGAFTPVDSFWTATALRFYLFGLPFAAIDQPLVFAFYARKNTLAPNLVKFAEVGLYLVVALALIQSYGMVGLVIANSAQLAGHALIMLWLGRTQLGFRRQGVTRMLVKVLTACGGMGLIAMVVEGSLGTSLAKVVITTAVAAVAYAGLLKLLRVHEAEQVWQALWSRVARAR